MVHEVVVVGGGIGGLTVAALLAARGVDVCLLERASQPGGVITSVEGFGYTFDPGVGIYPCWGDGQIHDRVFSELPVAAPEVRLDTPSYLVRLPERLDVPVIAKDDHFYATLVSAFPDSSDSAIDFYRQCSSFTDALTSGKNRGETRGVASYLTNTSNRFRHFVDAQLQLLTQRSLETCNFAQAAIALTIPRRGIFSIRGGAATLANRLAESIKQSGGRLRLDTPVLRLSYDSSGRAVGVDLLSGETVGASRAIVSNLTVWDTFGKLIGLNRSPAEIRKALSSMKGWGAYLLYLGINEATAAGLPANRILLASKQGDVDPESLQMVALAPAWDPRAPAGRRAVTVLTFTDVEHWFRFHESTEELEGDDQAKLEETWARLQESLPELGEDVEVIETSTPFTCYDQTRRKLGMVGSPGHLHAEFLNTEWSTSLENVFMVGDTASRGSGISTVTDSALRLSNKICQKA